MGAQFDHVPVLFNEALEALSISESGVYIDGTFGRGGHSGAILQQLGSDGKLLAIDKDPQAIAHGQEVYGEDERFLIKHGSFAMLQQLAQQNGVAGKVNGLLLDLGVSSSSCSYRFFFTRANYRPCYAFGKTFVAKFF